MNYNKKHTDSQLATYIHVYEVVLVSKFENSGKSPGSVKLCYYIC